MALNKRTGATMNQVKTASPVPWQRVLRHFMTVMVLLIVVGSGMFLSEQEIMPIKHVTIEGELKHTNQATLIDSVTPYVTGGFWDVDVMQIRLAGESLPWVKQIQVRRVWPDTLRLIVEEQTVIARWNGKGLVNQSGEVFYPETELSTKSLIDIHGPEGMSDMMARRLAKTQNELNQLGLAISELNMDKRRAWKLKFQDGFYLNLGRAHSEDRLARFIQVYQAELAQYKAQIEAVDMRYTNGLAVEWKQGQQPDFNGTV